MYDEIFQQLPTKLQITLYRVRGLNSLRVYPWVHSGSNTLNNVDQLRAATFPDVDPSDIPPQSQFTMAAGDFLEVMSF